MRQFALLTALWFTCLLDQQPLSSTRIFQVGRASQCNRFLLCCGQTGLRALHYLGRRCRTFLANGGLQTREIRDYDTAGLQCN